MVEQNSSPFNNDKSKEQIGKIERFTPETQDALEQRGKKIYTLMGKSMSQLMDEGVAISREWGSLEDVDKEMGLLRSRRSQVAIKDIKRMLMNQSFLKSFDKSVPTQIEIVEQDSRQLQQDVPGAKMIIGNPVDYLELAWEIQKTTGMDIFTSEYTIPFLSQFLKRKFKQHWFTRTDTPLKSVKGNFAFAVTFYQNEFHVSAWPRQEGNHIMGVFPLIVPAEQKSQE